MPHRSVLPALVAAAGISAAAASAAPAPLPWSEVVGALRAPAAAAPEPPPADRAGALEAILGGRSYPGPCAAPLLIALHQARGSLPAASRRLVDLLGPDPVRYGRILAPGLDAFPGAFRLRYTTEADQPGALKADDGDLDGVPDEARRILAALQEARAAVLAIFEASGTPVARPEAVEPVHEAEIGDLPGPLATWIWPAPGGAVLLVDRERALSEEGPALLRHGVAHLLQAALTRDESPWWYEAHAAWAEDPSGVSAARRAGSVGAYLASAPRGMEPDDAAAWEGALLWPHFLLAAGGPPRLLGLAWEEMSAVPGNNTLQGFDRALARLAGTTLQAEVRVFRIWNLFLGDLDDGRHYPFGSEMPTPPLVAAHAFPATITPPAALPALAGEVVHLIAGAGRGGWRLGFEGEEGAWWDVALVTVPSRLDGSPALAEMDLDERTRSVAAVPWRDVAAVFAVVQNLGGGRKEPLRYALSARYDPLVPFDLMSFTAEEDAAGVAVRWSTDREMDLLGFRLFRSRDPLSGFVPVTPALIPPAGGDEPASYLFLDAEARPGRKYYYLLEGVTTLGFTETSHLAAVRLPPPARAGRRGD
jgi:hypothetical protein